MPGIRENVNRCATRIFSFHRGSEAAYVLAVVLKLIMDLRQQWSFG
jgi:hypothetical protein